LLPWEELSEPDREVDRLIGEAVQQRVAREATEVCAEYRRTGVFGTNQSAIAHNCEQRILAHFGLDPKPAAEGE
jgi:hypothetical protein